LKIISNDKHSSLFRNSVNVKETRLKKKSSGDFKNIGAWKIAFLVENKSQN
jgi:hypothetical protein